jgi:hypothetical protein
MVKHAISELKIKAVKNICKAGILKWEKASVMEAVPGLLV